jgi:hypothetical protein
MKCIAGGRTEDHCQQFEQRAFARTALADESQFGTAHDVQAGNRQAECCAAGLIALYNVTQRENRRPQGKASSSSG